VIGIDVRSSEQLQAVILSVRSAPKNVQQNIKHFATADIIPAWQQELNEQGANPLQQVLLVDTGRATVTNTTVNLRSGGINAAVKGGLSTDYLSPQGSRSYRAAEFGANQYLTVPAYKSRSRKGRPDVIHNRHTQKQFKPYDKEGYVVYPAARKVIPRVAALWVSTVIRTLHEAFEGSLS
jgi:hypothetical protein